MIENSGFTVNASTAVTAAQSFVNPLDNKAAFATSLRQWFKNAARSLPWRETRDPYAIWVSEVMLQQTTVAAVRAYYLRFLEAFPDVFTLASADEISVLRLWAGLGYYRRARMLHRAAKIVVSQWDGLFPKNPVELEKLPGVGKYTANAIASFAYDVPVPTVEANTARVLCRLFGKPHGNSQVTAWHWEVAGKLLPSKQCREFNYALMELGSLICVASTPKCKQCPVCQFCAYFHQGEQQLPPRKATSARATIQLEWHLYLVQRGSNNPELLVRRIPDGEWHAGLYGFPYSMREAHKKWISSLRKSECVKLGRFTFCVTHHRIHAHVWLLRVPAETIGQLDSAMPFFACEWVPHQEILSLPLATPYRRALEFWEKGSQSC